MYIVASFPLGTRLDLACEKSHFWFFKVNADVAVRLDIIRRYMYNLRISIQGSRDELFQQR